MLREGEGAKEGEEEGIAEKEGEVVGEQATKEASANEKVVEIPRLEAATIEAPEEATIALEV